VTITTLLFSRSAVQCDKVTRSSAIASRYFKTFYNEVVVQSYTYSLRNVISLLFHFQNHRPTVAFWSLIFPVKDTYPFQTRPPYLMPWIRGGNQMLVTSAERPTTVYAKHKFSNYYHRTSISFPSKPRFTTCFQRIRIIEYRIRHSHGYLRTY
jgi:hypothetical protein